MSFGPSRTFAASHPNMNCWFIPAAGLFHAPEFGRLRCPAPHSAPLRKSLLKAASHCSHSALSASPWSSGDAGGGFVFWSCGPPIGLTLISPDQRLAASRGGGPARSAGHILALLRRQQ